MEVKEIDAEAAARLLSEDRATFVDVRDPGSYAAARIPGARSITDAEVRQFVAEADKARTLIVYCYHGNSSLGGAAYFQEQGFADVYSLSGGFEDWRAGNQPTES